MSLFSSIQMANNALQANQIGLQVVGQNIANANTPDYVREQVNLAPAPTQRLGGLLLGTGVEVLSITQQIDQFLEQRLRNANSDSAGAQITQQTYQQLEQSLNALSSNGVGGAMDTFFGSIADVLNDPNSVPTRNEAVLQGTTLVQDINQLGQATQQQRAEVNDQVTGMASTINSLVDQISSLNQQISQAQAGDTASSDAVGLSDQRLAALDQLSQLINIRVEKQDSGAYNVYCGGDYLVFGDQTRHVEVSQTTNRGQTISNIVFSDSRSALQATSGQLAGLINSRDQVLGGFEDQLDDFAKTLAGEFNRVYSSGQGLNGYTSLTSDSSVTNASAPLDNAGLGFTPVNGSFQIQVYNQQTQQTTTTNIQVDLNGVGNETSLNSLAAQLNAVSGLSATVTPDRKLKISSTSPNQQFSFANDTSGALAALGLNVFFTGDTATSLGIDQNVIADPAKFAASTSGIGAGTDNAVTMAGFLNQPLESQNNSTLSDLYDGITADLTQASANASATASGYSTYQQTLQGQQNATSGVNLDEETVNMLSYQRAFQASAKYISTLNDLLQTLVNL